MKKKIVIGKKLTRSDILQGFIITNIYALILLIILAIMIFPIFDVSPQIKTILIIVLVLIVWMSILPIIGSTQRLEVSDEGVKYYYVEGALNQFKEIFHVLFNNEEKPDFNLPLNKIKIVTLSYRSTLSGFGLKGYSIILKFLLEDNNIIKFIPYNVVDEGNNDKLYSDLLDYLQKMGIIVVDPYELKNKLKSNNKQEILNYINQIEEDDKNDWYYNRL